MLISASRSLLVVVDIQERLAPAIDGAARIEANTLILLAAAKAVGVPVLATEQYPRGLGHTVPALAEALPPGATLEKLHFSCAREPAFIDRVAASGRDQLILVGMEAHICVLQTALGLAEGGEREVFVVADAVGSRTPANAELALRRLAGAGVGVVSTEMVAFEWLERAGTPAFKEVSRLVK